MPTGGRAGKLTTLAYLLRHASSSVEADLWDLGIDLDEARAGGMRPSKVARLLLAQQPGARVWQELGGWDALPLDVVMAQQQIYVDVLIAHGQSGQSGKPPAPPTPPLGKIEERLRAVVRAATHEDKARAFIEATKAPDMQAMIEERLKTWGNISEHTEASRLNRQARQRMAEW